jgi:hypothetical protein
MSVNEITTTDFSRFGNRERRMAKEILNAWENQGLPEGFYDEEVVIMFNTHSGCVFLTNSEFRVAMMNGDKLELWYNCAYCEEEGFLEDLEGFNIDTGYCKEHE